jgi:signal transduction histidine kinase
MWDVITSGKIWKGDIKNKSKDGSFYWVRTMIMPIFSDDGKIKNFIAIRTDITSQVKLSEQLIQSERMSSIGQLSARMAHDIRNPLSIIRIALENLKLRYGADESAEKSFDRVTRSIDRIAHQTDDVLDFVRGFTPKLFKVKLSQIIEESTDSLTIPWNVTLILPKNDVEFFADGRLFSRVLNNLILNGIQTIDVKGVVEIMCEENNDAIVIQVKDSGRGIPKENLDKIFEPLFTTKQQGTGLGLASVQSIIESHGGIISVTSPPTVFTITLPKTNS